MASPVLVGHIGHADGAIRCLCIREPYNLVLQRLVFYILVILFLVYMEKKIKDWRNGDVDGHQMIE